MSEDNELDRLVALTARLARPAAPQGPLGRLIGRGGRAELLAALLAEIDETMLERRLGFATDTGQTFRCDAYGRRLLAVDPCPVQPPLASADEAGLAALRQALETNIGEASALYVESASLPEGRDPADVGVAAAVLARLWDCPPPPPPPAPLDELKAASDVAIAWLRIDGGKETGRGGIKDQAFRLAAFAASRLDELREESPNGAPRCIVLGRQDGGGVMVVGLDGSEALLMIVPTAALAGITAAWRQVVG